MKNSFAQIKNSLFKFSDLFSSSNSGYIINGIKVPYIPSGLGGKNIKHILVDAIAFLLKGYYVSPGNEIDQIDKTENLLKKELIDTSKRIVENYSECPKILDNLETIFEETLKEEKEDFMASPKEDFALNLGNICA